jgi:hypothetical protein
MSIATDIAGDIVFIEPEFGIKNIVLPETRIGMRNFPLNSLTGPLP